MEPQTPDLGYLYFAYLLAGHCLGDFVLQTRGMVEQKRRPRWLFAHTGTVTAAHLFCLLPFLSLPVLAVVVGVGGAHGIVDAVKVRLAPSRSGSLWPFTLDQAAHLAVLAAATWLLLRFPFQPLLPGFRFGITAALIVAAYAFNVNGSAAVVRAVLRRLPPPQGEADQVPGAGRAIGVLERMLAMTLVLLDQWGALGLVLAAKSIARFKDLDQRMSAEYYLVGTLASLLLAVASALLLRWLLTA